MRTTTPPGPRRFTVAIEGFGAFERSTLASFFRLAAGRSGAYHRVDETELADLLIADAGEPAVLERIEAAGRLRDTVFVGGEPPPGALAWLPRPIAPSRIVRELDTIAAQRDAATEAAEAPVTSTDPPEWIDTPPSVPLPMTDRRSHGRAVLVVEDSGIARKFLAMRLQRMGYAVHAARSGEQALELLGERAYQIVFVDVVLGPPGSLDGLRLCQYIKQRADAPGGSTPAVIVVTGLTGAMDKVRGSLAGCDAWLTKPLVTSEFNAALRKLDPALEIAD